MVSSCAAVKETAQAAKEREDRVRMVRERQNEERQRKLDELKAHALAAQRFREQKEEERRRRLEESRSRDTDRRHQVEERKRAIQEAERERREYLLRKNQEREARFETKRRNERSSIVFAFGSSTPRLLDPGEMGTVSPSQFWNHRRYVEKITKDFSSSRKGTPVLKLGLEISGPLLLAILHILVLL